MSGLLVKVKIEVLVLLSMDGCWGAGGVDTTAEYDIRVPDDIASPASPSGVWTAVVGLEPEGVLDLAGPPARSSISASGQTRGILNNMPGG